MFKLKLINTNFRPAFFSLAIVSGIYLAGQELFELQNTKNFFIFSFGVILIYISEVTITLSDLINENVIQTFRSILFSSFRVFMNLVFIPVITIISLLFFATYDINSFEKYSVLTYGFFLFYFLFKNVKNFKKFNEKNFDMGLIFDLNKLLLIFLTSFVLSAETHKFNIALEAATVLHTVLLSSIYFFTVSKFSKLNRNTNLWTVAIVLISSAIFAVFNYFDFFNIFEISIFLSALTLVSLRLFMEL